MARTAGTRRRTLEDIRMARADHDRDVEDLVEERDRLQHLLDTTIEQNRQALEEFDKLYSDQIAKLRAELAHKNGELEALRRYIAIVQTDHSVAAHFAAGAKVGIEHIERQAEQLLETVRAIHAKASQAADQAHEQTALEHGEPLRLPPAPQFGAPGSAPADDGAEVPKFLNPNQEESK